MRNALQKLSLASILLTLPFVANAKELPFKSADFAFDGQEILAAIDTDKLSPKGDVLYCRADINIKGTAERANCYAKSSKVELVIDSEQAVQQLAFSPAEVEGKTVPVRMSFRIAYTPIDDDTIVTLIPNLGTAQAQYGRDYVAPQERLDVSDWFEQYSENSWVGGKEFLGDGDMARVATTVDENGKPIRVQGMAVNRAYERDAVIVGNTLRRSRFIPGTANGRVVPMDYMVAVHYENRTEAYAKTE